MKILNLYAGIGGNRKLWDQTGKHEITAVEYNKEIADIYKDYYPQDKVIIADAHQYLLEHYKEYDFIWASPPCPSHSDLKRLCIQSGQNKAEYPEMQLYQEIILLKHFALKKQKWVIENVIPYYDYLIQPNVILDRHPFWCNFKIYEKKFRKKVKIIESKKFAFGFNLEKYKVSSSYPKKKILNNLVDPEIGLYILSQALGQILLEDKGLFD